MLALWFFLVQGGAMSRRNSVERKRFSVSVATADYEQLQRLAREHRPQVSLQYMVEYAIQRMLKDIGGSTPADGLVEPPRINHRE